MPKPRIWDRVTRSDTGILVLAALGIVLLHVIVNGRYGFHRDELLSWNNARHPAWGYVVYPPFTAYLAWVELKLFGTSLIGFRFFAAIAQGVQLVLTGLIAREFGGKREAQLMAGLAVALGGHSLVSGGFHSYTTFDYVWWVAAVYFVVRLLRSDDARWWLAIGAAIGMGIMTKFTMGFLVMGIVGGMLLTPARRFVRSPWFWCGVLTALVIALPNLWWQIGNDFATVVCERSIHARDIGRGWTDHFLLNQLWKCANSVTLPLWCAGLWYLFRTPEGKRYRMLGWMYVIPLLAFLTVRGRDYYLAPAYPMLLAAGATWAEQWLATLSLRAARIVRRVSWRILSISGLATAALTLQIAPLGTSWWHLADTVNGNFNMEIGWPEIAQTTAKIRGSLPVAEQAGVGILAADEGEAGAINLYGPAYGLPTAISGMNSYWMRGYGDPPPETLIALGMKREDLDQIFASCEWVGRVTNPYGVVNLTTQGRQEVYVCRHLRQPWPDFWKHFQYYG